MTESSTRLNIEILGISPYNKGALLMLEAIRQKFREQLPQARLAVPSSWPTDQRLELGLYCTYLRERSGLDKSRLMELLPRGFRQSVGFMSPNDVDVVLDASGFAYGDYWGLQKLQGRLGRTAGQWKTERKTLVLLPQAFGPFESPGMAEALRAALRKADLVFARDPLSLQHVQGVLGQVPHDTVRLSPDFTPLLKAELPARLEHVRGAVLIIPNEKMVAGDRAPLRDDYLAFLRCCAESLAGMGREVMVLVHEGAQDRRLARELNASLARPLAVIDEPSPVVTKAVIGAAHAVVSSRFHGLVSALSAAVPTLACGWTHKYQALMTDYGCPEFNIDMADRASWPDKLALLERAAQDDAVRGQLQAAVARQRSLGEAMWASVFELLRHRHPAQTAAVQP
ncbi:MAG: polysaccharide pyruvyl transferase family protein [Pseudorhodoferax sp.]